MSALLATDSTLRSLRAYLLSKGWVATPHPNNRIEVFAAAPDERGESVPLVLPRTPEFKDSAQLINEAAKLLADIAGVEVSAIQDQISKWDRDILRSRFFRVHGHEDTLPLAVAANVISGLKEFLGYAAYTHSNPCPFFDKAGQISTKFVELCRFGHTFEGSFGLKIECPLAVVQTLPIDGILPEVPTERQVFDRVAVGLSNLRASVAADSIDPLLTGYLTGFNANMCRALVEVFEHADGRRIEYDMTWSPQLMSPFEAAWKPMVFDGRAYEFARAAAGALEKSESYPDSLIEGHIVELKSDMPPGLDAQQEFEHRITMHWERERGQTVKVRISLSSDQYKAACDAHKDGRLIRLHGVPEKVGKFWTLTRIHDFAVLPGTIAP